MNTESNLSVSNIWLKKNNMTQISSYVFFDTETTGLPWKERNRTKIIELSFVSVLRQDIESTPFGSMPPTKKLTFVLNPKKPIARAVTQLTGLSSRVLRSAPVFKEKTQAILTHLQELPKPVCLVAHNGNTFDFKILLAEFNDVNISVPHDILCVDSLVGFRKLLKGTSVCYNTLLESSKSTVDSDIMTDDEDEWPDLNLSTEEWRDIDNKCLPLYDVSQDEISNAELSSDTETEFNICKDYTEKVMDMVFKRKPKLEKTSKLKDKANKENYAQTTNSKPEKVTQCYKLSALYKRLLNKEAINAHRAEADCLMLLECVMALRNEFLPWADGACIKLSDIMPLMRY